MWLLLLACATPGPSGKVVATADSVPLPADDSLAVDSPPIDESPPLPTTWYADADGDGFGDPANSQDSVDPPEGWVADTSDCDDTNPAVHPGATETCDSRDEDCDGVVDNGAGVAWYADLDLDGWGAGDPSIGCQAPAGFVSEPGDCDDADAGIHPEAEDPCEDGLDQDCLGGDLRCAMEGSVAVEDVAYATWLGRHDGEYDVAGSYLSCDADMDGDGVPELAIMATQQFTGRGLFWVVPARDPGVHDLDDAPWMVEGDDLAPVGEGNVVGSVGDLDGDGGDELLVGGFLFTNPLPTVASAAQAEITESAVVPSEPWGVVPLGDFRYAVSGYFRPQNQAAGAVLILEGLPSGVVDAPREAVASLFPTYFNDDTFFGAGLCSGDMNGDGVLDIAVGAPGQFNGDAILADRAGVVYVAYGPFENDLLLTDPLGRLAAADAGIWAVDGETVQLGRAVSCAGDVSGDGLVDLLVSAPSSYAGWEDNELIDYSAGAAWLFTETLRGRVTTDDATGAIHGVHESDSVGFTIESDVDLNTDGRADVVIGAADSERGAFVVLFYGEFVGEVQLTDADVTVTGNPEDGGVGPVAGCPDINGDGAQDLLVGAGSDSTYAPFAGAAHLLLGGGH